MVVTKDDKECCRSLVCDANGIIIAEMIYRCMVCSCISDSISAAQKHYRFTHIENEELFEKSDNELNGKHETNVNNKIKKESNEINEQKAIKIENEMEDEEDISDDLDDISYLDQYDTFEAASKYDSFEASTSLSTLNKSKNTQGNSSADRGGFVTCTVCDVTKYYASVQRRYGQSTCMGCAKFFGRFLLKPRRYSCPNLGSCPLNSGPRCKACLLLACINTYQIDEKRMATINAYRPLRKAILPKQQQEYSDHISNTQENINANTSSNDVEFETNLSSDELPVIVPMNINLTSKHTPIRPKPAAKKSANRVSPFKTSVKKNWGCRKCAGCLVEDCGKCNYCRDKPKFGGPNTLKKKCILRKCFVLEEQKEREANERLNKIK